MKNKFGNVKYFTYLTWNYHFAKYFFRKMKQTTKDSATGYLGISYREILITLPSIDITQLLYI